MATVEEPRTESRPFIRPDGKDKVTGLGRYTADMTLTGMLHARFVYAPTTHARLVRVDTSKARALPGVLAVITHADVPDVLHGPFVPDRRLFAKDVVRFEGEVVAAVAALTPDIAARAAELVEIDFEALPAISDPEAALADGAPLIHPSWESYEALEDLVRSGNCASRSTIVKGDVDAGHGRGRGRRPRALHRRHVARGADRAPRGDRAVGGRPRHDLVVDAGAVPGAQHRRAHAPAAGGARPHHRAAARWRLRRQVRAPLRGARRRARSRCGTPGEARLLASRGVHGA